MHLCETFRFAEYASAHLRLRGKFRELKSQVGNLKMRIETMSLNDPISDMLTRIRNATMAGHLSVQVPSSKMKVAICQVLKKEGYIKDFKVEEGPSYPLLTVELKYTKDRKSVIQGLRRVSKPSLRKYSGYRELKPVRSGFGIQIMSTPKGVMTGREAKRLKLGGEIICEVW